MTKPWMLGDSLMRRDLRLLCWMLRHELLREGREEVWREVVDLRRLALRHEQGDLAADVELRNRFQACPLDQLDGLLRVLGLFFEFSNVAEDLQRERVLRSRRREGRLHDSLSSRLGEFTAREPSASSRQRLLSGLQAEFVFTAHPTEAKRQTVRRTLARIRRGLRALGASPGRQRRRNLLSGLKEEVRALVRTDPLHPHRPEVLEELDRALFVDQALWRAVPPLVRALDRAGLNRSVPLRFGCWIGGDRDGHPHVTTEVTKETLTRLRRHARKLHLRECDRLAERLPMQCRNPAAAVCLEGVMAGNVCGELTHRLSRLHPSEHYRRVLETIRYRLNEVGESGYRGADAFLSDLRALRRAMKLDGLTGGIAGTVSDWERRARVFGLHFMRLDLRENSRGYRELMRGLLPLLGEDPGRVERDDFSNLWEQPFPRPDDAVLWEALGERGYDLLRVTALMREEAAAGYGESVGVNVISMTHCAGDVLWVVWLHRLLASWEKGGGSRFAMPISPLFETIDDLERAADIFTELLACPAYRDWLTRSGGRQVVMIGYSDSAKDGGYAAACWALYRGQEDLQRVADAQGVALTCFHGRGGSLGRGGGPAARAISALPPANGHGHIRMTEQGEVIADRFADSRLAHRHMEQILGGLLLHAAGAARPEADWRDCMRQIAERGRESYLALFQHPGFPQYFRYATPVACIENLPIGSRPSRRHGAASLEDLRAIPYTFSWTQSRQLINAFYGLGTAWERLSRKHKQVALDMYRRWPFFKSMIDNAELALAKCDEGIAREYATLVPDAAVGRELGDAIAAEMRRTREAVLALTERPSLMADNPWLRRSVEIRKPFIDVLNHLQIELIRRERVAHGEPALQRSLRLSVQGIAAGLRTTG